MAKSRRKPLDYVYVETRDRETGTIRLIRRRVPRRTNEAIRLDPEPPKPAPEDFSHTVRTNDADLERDRSEQVAVTP